MFVFLETVRNSAITYFEKSYTKSLISIKTNMLVELEMTAPSISDHKFEATFVLKWVRMFSFNNFGT